MFGTDPKSPAAGNLITTESVGDNFIITFIRDDRSKTSDLALSAEAGETLGAWPQSFTVGETTATSTTPGVTVTANGNGSDTVTVANPTTRNGYPMIRVDTRIYKSPKAMKEFLLPLVGLGPRGPLHPSNALNTTGPARRGIVRGETRDRPGPR